MRDVNEDSYLADPPVFVVADGMGGHDGGDIASRIVVEEFVRIADDDYDALRGAEAVTEALHRCQRRLDEYGDTHRGSDGGPLAAAGPPPWSPSFVEDIFFTGCWPTSATPASTPFGGGGALRVSVDHSLVQEVVDAGEITEEEAAVPPERHIVTRALGGPDDVEPDFFVLPSRRVRAGPAVLRRGHRDDRRPRDLGRLLAESADPGAAADRIVAAAVDRGRHRQRDGGRRRCGGINPATAPMAPRRRAGSAPRDNREPCRDREPLRRTR